MARFKYLMRGQFLAVVLAFTLINPQISWAQGTASEPTQIINMIELLMSYIQQISSYAKQGLSYQLQYKQYEDQIKSGSWKDAGIQYGVNSSDESDYKRLVLLLSSSGDLKDNLGKLKTYQDNRFSSFAASGKTWGQYLENEGAANQARLGSSDILSANEKYIMTRADKNMAAINQYASEIDNTSSLHDTMITLSAQMNTLLSVMTTTMRADSARSQHAVDLEVIATQSKEAAKDDYDSGFKARQAEIAVTRRRAQSAMGLKPKLPDN